MKLQDTSEFAERDSTKILVATYVDFESIPKR